MNAYTDAINEYNLEDENGQSRLIYAYFGLAIYFSQILEETFSIMLWSDKIFKQEVQTSSEVNEIIDTIENSKKTMGNFINEVKQSYSLTEKLTIELKLILGKRNYLVHKYFKIEVQKLLSGKGRKEMLKYFCDFMDEAQSINEELQVYYSKYTDSLGLTQERIEELMAEMKNEEIERVKNSN